MESFGDFYACYLFFSHIIQYKVASPPFTPPNSRSVLAYPRDQLLLIFPWEKTRPFRDISKTSLMFCQHDCLCTMYIRSSEEDVEFLEVELHGSFKWPYGCWVLNFYPLKEQPVLLLPNLLYNPIIIFFLGVQSLFIEVIPCLLL